MNGPPWSLRECGRSFARQWNAFFLVPADARLVGLLRVVYASLLLIDILCWWPELTQWFGEQGITPWKVADELRHPNAWTVFAWLPTDQWVLYTCYSIFIVQTVLLLLGIYPRLQAVCTFIWLVSFLRRQSLVWDSEDTVFRLLGLYLIFLPLQLSAWVSWSGRTAGNAAADAKGNATNDAPSGWAIRLIQIQMCIIFLDAAFAKLQGNAWLDGTAVYYASRLDEFAVVGAVPNFFFDVPWIVKLMTWGTIALEAAAPIMLWFRETRRSALILLLVFHVACAWTMHLFLFHWIMLCGWAAFLTSEDLDWIAAFGRGLFTKLPVSPQRSTTP